MKLDSHYTLDLSKFFYIWFSKNPKESLPTLNKVRLVNAVKRNAHTQFTLIYSSRCLSENARLDLEEFTTGLGVNLVDFDTELLEAPTTEMDQHIAQIASSEIEAARKREGGNMAAASDCVRLLECTLRDYGNYLDLDVDLNLNSLPSLNHQVRWPVIISNCTFIMHGAKIPSLTNHFVGAARDAADRSQLHDHSVQKLSLVKQRIIENYQGKHPDMLTTEFGVINKVTPEYKEAIETYFKEANNNIITFRRDLESFNISLGDVYKDTVLCVSGPFAYFYMFDDAMRCLEGEERLEDRIIKMIRLLIRALESCGYQQNGLGQSLLTQDTAENQVEEYDGTNNHKTEKEVIGRKCDLSWTDAGSGILSDKSKILDKAITTIQAHIRGWRTRKSLDSKTKLDKARNTVVLAQISNHYRSEGVIAEVTPGQALRRAASGFHSLERMQRLLDTSDAYHKDIINQKDSNPRSGKTALHQAIENGQAERAFMLLKAGASKHIKDARQLTAYQLFLDSTHQAITGNQELAELLSDSPKCSLM